MTDILRFCRASLCLRRGKIGLVQILHKMNATMCFYVGIGCKLLFAVHALVSEAFSKGVGADLQLCDLETTKK